MNTAASADEKRENLRALSLAKECYAMKPELLTNVTVADYAIRLEKKGQYSPSKGVGLRERWYVLRIIF